MGCKLIFTFEKVIFPLPIKSCKLLQAEAGETDIWNCVPVAVSNGARGFVIDRLYCWKELLKAEEWKGLCGGAAAPPPHPPPLTEAPIAVPQPKGPRFLKKKKTPEFAIKNLHFLGPNCPASSFFLWMCFMLYVRKLQSPAQLFCWLCFASLWEVRMYDPRCRR